MIDTVNIVVDLVIEESRIFDLHNMTAVSQYIDIENSTTVPFHKKPHIIDMKCSHQIVPLTSICENGKEDLFISYTPKVERLLGMPFSVLKKSLDSTQSLNSKYRFELLELGKKHNKLSNSLNNLKSSWFKRMIFLFTGIVEDA